MFFRPNFCANCGEKIERGDWGIFTSRRFCVVCESEFKGQDLIPRAIVIGGVLLGVLGVGGYIKSGPSSEPLVARAAKRTQEPEPQPSLHKAATTPASETVNATNNVSVPRSFTSAPPASDQPSPKVVDAEPMYYCGAQTKKGTPCSRRVKGMVRCYQHTGMPAMLPPEKLRIN